MPRMLNWGIIRYPDPYTAPEILPYSVQGEVIGHPDRPDGEFIALDRGDGLS